MDKNLSPEENIKILSKIKGQGVFNSIKGDIVVISADTMVVYNNEIIGKPRDYEDGYNILSKLSNNIHFVYTCVSIFNRDGDREEIVSILDKSKVYMGSISPDEIKGYLKTGEPQDKAGAYGIQGLGGMFVDKIEGDFYNVEGLPLRKVYLQLKEFGVYPLYLW